MLGGQTLRRNSKSLEGADRKEGVDKERVGRGWGCEQRKRGGQSKRERTEEEGAGKKGVDKEGADRKERVDKRERESYSDLGISSRFNIIGSLFAFLVGLDQARSGLQSATTPPFPS